MAESLPCEGVFAIHKPTAISSAQVIRDAQTAFRSSDFFKPWLEREQANKDADNRSRRRKRRSWKDRQPLQVKMGHGGTLDPLATGVLILGVGNGTKHLNRFLQCTKTYEAVVLFGAATDSYDSVGRVVSRKPYEHVTKSMVEGALDRFRGKIKQRPPIFSALRVQGKRLYEYAREGKEVPVEIQERPVEVEDLELLDWMEGGTHEYHWPVEEAETDAKEMAEKLMNVEQHHASSESNRKLDEESVINSAKRKRDDQTEDQDAADPENFEPAGQPPSPKRPKSSPEPFARGHHPSPPPPADQPPCPAPAARIRMTVTSGFYVRSFAHDLGLVVDSLGIMASLVRTRQGQFELGKNVLQYGDLGKGEGVWGFTVKGMLKDWQVREAEGRDVDGEETVGKGSRGGGSAWSRKRGGSGRRNSSSEDD